MRVLIVHPRFYIYGGAELVIIRLANYLTKKGIKNAILTTDILPQVKNDLIDTEVMVSRVLKIRPRDFAEFLSLHQKVGKLMDKFDLINPHNYPAELSVLFRHKPNIWLCNEPPEIAMGSAEDRSAIIRMINRCFIGLDKFTVKRYVNNVVVADRFNAGRFEKLYDIKPHIIPYGIDYDFFTQQDDSSILKELNISDSFLLLQVGTLTPFKNQIASLETIKKLKSIIPGIKLILAGWGEGTYMQKIQSYIQENHLIGDVVITGHLGRQAIRQLYWAADLLLHPIKSQGGWLVPFEALCAGKPIIVSPNMSASDIINVENIGIVTDNYAEAVLKIYQEQQKYNLIAEKGKAWVRDNLSWDKFCQKMTDLFYQVVVSRKD